MPAGHAHSGSCSLYANSACRRGVGDRQLCTVAPGADVCCRALDGELNMGLVGSS